MLDGGMKSEHDVSKGDIRRVLFLPVFLCQMEESLVERKRDRARGEPSQSNMWSRV